MGSYSDLPRRSVPNIRAFSYIEYFLFIFGAKLLKAIALPTKTVQWVNIINVVLSPLLPLVINQNLMQLTTDKLSIQKFYKRYHKSLFVYMHTTL